MSSYFAARASLAAQLDYELEQELKRYQHERDESVSEQQGGEPRVSTPSLPSFSNLSQRDDVTRSNVSSPSLSLIDHAYDDAQRTRSLFGEGPAQRDDNKHVYKQLRIVEPSSPQVIPAARSARSTRSHHAHRSPHHQQHHHRRHHHHQQQQHTPPSNTSSPSLSKLMSPSRGADDPLGQHHYDGIHVSRLVPSQSALSKMERNLKQSHDWPRESRDQLHQLIADAEKDPILSNPLGDIIDPSLQLVNPIDSVLDYNDVNYRDPLTQLSELNINDLANMQQQLQVKQQEREQQQEEDMQMSKLAAASAAAAASSDRYLNRYAASLANQAANDADSYYPGTDSPRFIGPPITPPSLSPREQKLAPPRSPATNKNVKRDLFDISPRGGVDGNDDEETRVRLPQIMKVSSVFQQPQPQQPPQSFNMPDLLDPNYLNDNIPLRSRSSPSAARPRTPDLASLGMGMGISAHDVTPVCGLCHDAPATVWCPDCQLALCTGHEGCDAAIHVEQSLHKRVELAQLPQFESQKSKKLKELKQQHKAKEPYKSSLTIVEPPDPLVLPPRTPPSPPSLLRLSDYLSSSNALDKNAALDFSTLSGLCGVCQTNKAKIWCMDCKIPLCDNDHGSTDRTCESELHTGELKNHNRVPFDPAIHKRVYKSEALEFPALHEDAGPMSRWIHTPPPSLPSSLQPSPRNMKAGPPSHVFDLNFKRVDYHTGEVIPSCDICRENAAMLYCYDCKFFLCIKGGCDSDLHKHEHEEEKYNSDIFKHDRRYLKSNEKVIVTPVIPQLFLPTDQYKPRTPRDRDHRHRHRHRSHSPSSSRSHIHTHHYSTSKYCNVCEKHRATVMCLECEMNFCEGGTEEERRDGEERGDNCDRTWHSEASFRKHERKRVDNDYIDPHSSRHQQYISHSPSSRVSTSRPRTPGSARATTPTPGSARVRTPASARREIEQEKAEEEREAQQQKLEENRIMELEYSRLKREQELSELEAAQESERQRYEEEESLDEITLMERERKARLRAAREAEEAAAERRKAEDRANGIFTGPISSRSKPLLPKDHPEYDPLTVANPMCDQCGENRADIFCRTCHLFFCSHPLNDWDMKTPRDPRVQSAAAAAGYISPPHTPHHHNNCDFHIHSLQKNHERVILPHHKEEQTRRRQQRLQERQVEIERKAREAREAEEEKRRIEIERQQRHLARAAKQESRVKEREERKNAKILQRLKEREALEAQDEERIAAIRSQQAQQHAAYLRDQRARIAAFEAARLEQLTRANQEEEADYQHQLAQIMKQDADMRVEEQERWKRAREEAQRKRMVREENIRKYREWAHQQLVEQQRWRSQVEDDLVEIQKQVREKKRAEKLAAQKRMREKIDRARMIVHQDKLDLRVPTLRDEEKTQEQRDQQQAKKQEWRKTIGALKQEKDEDAEIAEDAIALGSLKAREIVRELREKQKEDEEFRKEKDQLKYEAIMEEVRLEKIAARERILANKEKERIKKLKAERLANEAKLKLFEEKLIQQQQREERRERLRHKQEKLAARRLRSIGEESELSSRSGSTFSSLTGSSYTNRSQSLKSGSASSRSGASSATSRTTKSSRSGASSSSNIVPPINIDQAHSSRSHLTIATSSQSSASSGSTTNSFMHGKPDPSLRNHESQRSDVSVDSLERSDVDEKEREKGSGRIGLDENGSQIDDSRHQSTSHSPAHSQSQTNYSLSNRSNIFDDSHTNTSLSSFNSSIDSQTNTSTTHSHSTGTNDSSYTGSYDEEHDEYHYPIRDEDYYDSASNFSQSRKSEESIETRLARQERARVAEEERQERRRREYARAHGEDVSDSSSELSSDITPDELSDDGVKRRAAGKGGVKKQPVVRRPLRAKPALQLNQPDAPFKNKQLPLSQLQQDAQNANANAAAADHSRAKLSHAEMQKYLSRFGDDRSTWPTAKEVANYQTYLTSPQRQFVFNKLQQQNAEKQQQEYERERRRLSRSPKKKEKFPEHFWPVLEEALVDSVNLQPFRIKGQPVYMEGTAALAERARSRSRSRPRVQSPARPTRPRSLSANRRRSTSSDSSSSSSSESDSRPGKARVKSKVTAVKKPTNAVTKSQSVKRNTGVLSKQPVPAKLKKKVPAKSASHKLNSRAAKHEPPSLVHDLQPPVVQSTVSTNARVIAIPTVTPVDTTAPQLARDEELQDETRSLTSYDSHSTFQELRPQAATIESSSNAATNPNSSSNTNTNSHTHSSSNHRVRTRSRSRSLSHSRSHSSDSHSSSSSSSRSSRRGGRGRSRTRAHGGSEDGLVYSTDDERANQHKHSHSRSRSRHSQSPHDKSKPASKSHMLSQLDKLLSHPNLSRRSHDLLTSLQKDLVSSHSTSRKDREVVSQAIQLIMKHVVDVDDNKHDMRQNMQDIWQKLNDHHSDRKQYKTMKMNWMGQQVASTPRSPTAAAAGGAAPNSPPPVVDSSQPFSLDQDFTVTAPAAITGDDVIQRQRQRFQQLNSYHYTDKERKKMQSDNLQAQRTTQNMFQSQRSPTRANTYPAPFQPHDNVPNVSTTQMLFRPSNHSSQPHVDRPHRSRSPRHRSRSRHQHRSSSRSTSRSRSSSPSLAQEAPRRARSRSHSPHTRPADPFANDFDISYDDLDEDDIEPGDSVSQANTARARSTSRDRKHAASKQKAAEPAHVTAPQVDAPFPAQNQRATTPKQAAVKESKSKSDSRRHLSSSSSSSSSSDSDTSPTRNRISSFSSILPHADARDELSWYSKFQGKMKEREEKKMRDTSSVYGDKQHSTRESMRARDQPIPSPYPSLSQAGQRHTNTSSTATHTQSQHQPPFFQYHRVPSHKSNQSNSIAKIDEQLNSLRQQARAPPPPTSSAALSSTASLGYSSSIRNPAIHSTTFSTASASHKLSRSSAAALNAHAAAQPSLSFVQQGRRKELIERARKL